MKSASKLMNLLQQFNNGPVRRHDLKTPVCCAFRSVVIEQLTDVMESFLDEGEIIFRNLLTAARAAY